MTRVRSSFEVFTSPSLLVMAMIFVNSVAHAATSPSYIPQALATAIDLGPADNNEILHFSAVLPLQQPAVHRKLISSQNANSRATPMEPSTYRRMFHPPALNIAKVIAALALRAIEVDGDPKGLVIPLRARLGAIQDALGVEYHRFQTPSGVTFLGFATEPNLPQDLEIDSFSGLIQGLPQSNKKPISWRPLADEKKPLAGSKIAAQASTPPAVNATTMRLAYNVPDSARGKGQTVGLLCYCTADSNDLNLYATTNGLPMPKLVTYALPGNGCPDEWRGECALDHEMIMTMAPELDELRLILLGDFVQAMNELANPTLGDGKLVTTFTFSGGFDDANLSAQEQANLARFLAQMTAQGQTLFVASGDGGAFTDGAPQGLPGHLDSVCCVGGTELKATSAGAYISETGWNGSGGGISTLSSLPDYQKPVAKLGGPYSAKFRNSPDVAMIANNASFSFEGKLGLVGGTSVASPLWAGVLALIKESRAAKGLPAIGFLNPVVYALGAAGGDPYATAFNDITTGSNGAYAAQTGYDLVTGWGTPNVAGMLRVLGGAPEPMTMKPVPFLIPAAFAQTP